MIRKVAVILIILLLAEVSSFPVHDAKKSRRRPFRFQVLRVLNGGSDRIIDDINERSRHKAQEGDSKSAVAGAVLGGLVCGPFGMIFGASIGQNLGSKKAFDRAKVQELSRLGLTQEMLDVAQDVSRALENGIDGLKATEESLRSQQSLAKVIDADVNDLYEKAKDALNDGREDEAKSFLLERNKNMEALKNVLKRCAEEKERKSIMEENVNTLQKRALEAEALIQRAVGARARDDASSSFNYDSLSLDKHDPLLQKFKDPGID